MKLLRELQNQKSLPKTAEMRQRVLIRWVGISKGPHCHGNAKMPPPILNSLARDALGPLTEASYTALPMPISNWNNVNRLSSNFIKPCRNASKCLWNTKRTRGGAYMFKVNYVQNKTVCSKQKEFIFFFTQPKFCHAITFPCICLINRALRGGWEEAPHGFQGSVFCLPY